MFEKTKQVYRSPDGKLISRIYTHDDLRWFFTKDVWHMYFGWKNFWMFVKRV